MTLWTRSRTSYNVLCYKSCCVTMKQPVVELCRSVQAETENSVTPVWFFWRAKEKPVVSLKKYESSPCLNACYNHKNNFSELPPYRRSYFFRRKLKKNGHPVKIPTSLLCDHLLNTTRFLWPLQDAVGRWLDCSVSF